MTALRAVPLDDPEQTGWARILASRGGQSRFRARLAGRWYGVLGHGVPIRAGVAPRRTGGLDLAVKSRPFAESPRIPAVPVKAWGPSVVQRQGFANVTATAPS